jgi:cobalt-zinc-cadmium efflux system membrane fusion protein
MIKLTTVLLVMCIGSAHAADTITIEDLQLERLGVRFSSANSVDEQYSRILPGKVRLPVDQQYMISAPLSGRITHINVASGDEVDSDKVIAIMESPELLDLQRAFLSAAGKYRLDRESYTRDKTLFDEGIIAQRRLLEARYTYQQTSAKLHESRQLLQIAGMSEKDIEQLESKSELTNRLEIKAGVSGYVLEQEISIGNYVETGEPLFQVGQTNPLWVLVDVPEEQADNFQLGAGVVIVGCGETEGRLIASGKSVDPVSQTIQLRVEVSFNAGTTPCLKPGQFVQARIKSSQSRSIYEIPATATVHHDGQTLIFVRGNKSIEARVVEVLSRHGSLLRVQGELDDKTQIAVEGTAALKAALLGMGGGE